MPQDPWYAFSFGGISCMVAALFTHPIDSLKVRLQLHNSKISKADFVSAIIRKEGFLSLWRGLSASLLREATYSTLRMALYNPSKAIFGLSKDPRNVPLWKMVGAGLVAGSIGASITSPFDLLKIRFQAAKAPKGLIATGIDIYRLEGFKGLYRGVSANVVRAAVLTASQLASYDQAKQSLKAHAGFEEGLLLHCTASFIAGAICATTTNPVVILSLIKDVVKSRYMNQTFINGRGLLFLSPMSCLIETAKTEGIRALFKGWLPSWMRIGPHSIITFIVLEKLRYGLGLEPF